MGKLIFKLAIALTTALPFTLVNAQDGDKNFTDNAVNYNY